MSYNSAKGYRGEVGVLETIDRSGVVLNCYRPRAGSPNDVGDIGGLPIIVSVKNHATLALPNWVDALPAMCEAGRKATGVVWHKRRGKGNAMDWYVTTSGRLFLPFLAAYIEAAP